LAEAEKEDEKEAALLPLLPLLLLLLLLPLLNLNLAGRFSNLTSCSAPQLACWWCKYGRSEE